MNQSSEVEHPYEGQKFTSFDALKKYLEEYGKKTFVKFWIRSSHTRNSLKSRISKIMNPDLRYVSVKFACIYGGEKIRCRGSGIRKSSTYRNLGCPCMINAVVGEDGNHVKLDTVILEHNHVLSKTMYDSIKKSKRKCLTLKNSKEVIGNSVLINDQELEVYNSELSYNSIVAEIKTETNELNSQEEVINSEYESVNDSKSTQNCLKNVKDKYGRNVKILVVSSDDTKSDLVLNSIDDKTSEDVLEIKNEEEATELSQICRLCLSAKDKLSPIFNPDLPVKSTVLSFKIMGCASIEISSNDGLPNNICSTCEADLDVAYNFRVRCENSDSILRKACLRSDNIRTAESLRESSEKVAEVLDENPNQNAISYLETPLETEEANQTPVNELPNNESLYVEFVIYCPICNGSFETYETMLDHLGTHTDYETLLLECNICNVLCPTVKELQEHIGGHFRETRTEMVACDQCGATFATADELKKHEETHTQKKQSDVNYLCNVCGKILKSKDQFQAHKNAHEGLRPHVCLKCGRGFADRKNMHQHYEVVHLRRAKHECPVCQKKFYTRTKMKSHITMHYGVKPFTCDVCHKTFRLKMNMIKHKKTHSNDRPHQCDKCNAAFIDKNMLKRHSYIHGGIRPYPCPVCGHRFSVKFHLKKHLEKSKCSEEAIIDSESNQWVSLSQPEVNLSGEECVVVYKTNDEIALKSETETVAINMDILQEYNQEASC